MIDYIKQWKFNYDTKPLFNKQVKVFLLLFVGYASLHCMRTGWSFTQKYIQDDLPEITDSNIGLMDTFFLLFLGIGLYFCGNISDKFNPKSFLLFGMLFSAFSLMSVGISRVFFITDPYFYAFLQGLNGLFESACLPGYMRMLGNWYSSENRGLLLGIWSGCRSFGDSAGLLVGDMLILRLKFSWYWTLVCFGSITVIGAYSIYEWVSHSPQDTGLPTIIEVDEECSIINPSYLKKHPTQLAFNQGGLSRPSKDQTNMGREELDQLREKLILKYGNSEIYDNENTTESQAISILQALKIPGVFWYTLDFMLLKSLNYGILFWFPKFLQQNHLENNSSGISIMWSGGVLIGGICSGYFGDKLHKKRAIIMPPSLFFLILSLAWFDSLKSEKDPIFLFYLASLFIGFFLGGPYNVQHGPLIIDLGKHSVLQGKKQAVGTVTGIIEGAGSLSSSLIQLAIPYFGQQNIFNIFIVISLMAILAILPLAIQDYQYLKQQPSIFVDKNPQTQLHEEMKELEKELEIR